ncbi:AGE family epimerase/isomerase [Mesorhizobium sp. SB112]|uniref:AGE family epimerase/isomerase n=1 Tax=Mesorhizobium sp. SB112 TaxID=3151853 RepID=UPI0032657891
MTAEMTVPREGPWWGTDAHRTYLLADAQRQLDFFRRSLDPAGGFHAQDFDGNPIPGAARELHATTRMVHSFAIGQLAGFTDTKSMIDHGMEALWKHHRDTKHGGYVWAFEPDGVVLDDRKLAYGHAFVLLAGASAKMGGHPDADRLIADVMEVIDTRFWDHALGRMKEEYTRGWQTFSSYRGMNANMHMSEALLAAAEATGDRTYAARARKIFDFFVGEIGAAHDWRLPEHYTEDWQIDPDYEGNPMFRPKGATPGHSFELARLLLQLRDMGGGHDAQLLEWSRNLYRRARADGWDEERGGLFYTVDPATGKPLRRSRYWWPVTEAIGAAAAMIKAGEDCAEDYRLFWETGETLFIDSKRGGWLPEVDNAGKPDGRQFAGKPDIYHSLQAALYPLMPGLTGFAKGRPA